MKPNAHPDCNAALQRGSATRLCNAALRRCRELLAAMPDPAGICSFLYEELVGLNDIDETNAEGETALHYACAANHAACVRILLGHGASPHVRGMNGQTPVCRTESEEIVRLLKEAGADVHAVDDFGSTCLFLVKNTALIDLLVSKGAKVNMCNKEGKTPLHYASTVKAATTLLRHGRSLSSRLDWLQGLNRGAQFIMNNNCSISNLKKHRKPN